MSIRHGTEEIDRTLGSILTPQAVHLAQTQASGLLANTQRMAAQRPGETGWWQGATVRRGFSIVITDVARRERYAEDFLAEDHLKLHCKLDGPSLISVADEESSVRPGRLSYLVQPAGSVKNEVMNAGSRMRAVTLICSREFLGELLPDRTGLPSVVQDYLRGSVAQFTHRDAALTPTMRRITQEVLDLQCDRLAELMLEAKALELLYLSLRELADASDTDPIKPRVRRKVEELCELLDSHEGAIMSIAQLSRALAWNETQMMESFKQVTGTTISSFRQRRRMERALDQLRTTDRSITEIAFDAGYEHPGNFATAFRRSFGCSPRHSRSQFA